MMIGSAGCFIDHSKPSGAFDFLPLGVRHLRLAVEGGVGHVVDEAACVGEGVPTAVKSSSFLPPRDSCFCE
jgi:hypothetical protein